MNIDEIKQNFGNDIAGTGNTKGSSLQKSIEMMTSGSKVNAESAKGRSLQKSIEMMTSGSKVNTEFVKGRSLQKSIEMMTSGSKVNTEFAKGRSLQKSIEMMTSGSKVNTRYAKSKSLQKSIEMMNRISRVNAELLSNTRIPILDIRLNQSTGSFSALNSILQHPGKVNSPYLGRNFLKNMNVDPSFTQSIANMSQGVLKGTNFKGYSTINPDTMGTLVAGNWAPALLAMRRASISEGGVAAQLAKAQTLMPNDYFSKTSHDLAKSLMSLKGIQNKQVDRFINGNVGDIETKSLSILSDYDADVEHSVPTSTLNSLDDDTLEFNSYIQKLDQVAKGDSKLKMAAKILIQLLRDTLMVALMVTPIVTPIAELEQQGLYYSALSLGMIAPRAYVDVTQAPVRTGHSIKAKIIVYLTAQSEVKVIKKVGKWAQVKITYGYNHEYGWVQKRFLNIND